MKPMLDCREVTALVLAGEDRRLSWRERLGIRLHMVICEACPHFVRQVTLMRRALNRWKADAEASAE